MGGKLLPRYQIPFLLLRRATMPDSFFPMSFLFPSPRAKSDVRYKAFFFLHPDYNLLFGSTDVQPQTSEGRDLCSEVDVAHRQSEMSPLY